ncbi:hypothetical protein GCM10022225_83480 [Plantactinospora mayteni]|uniref:Uncharacterized protein n=1 Tax=Plantactinospora mayteni TaxID=566021 RepID=A0ABQ4F4D4_9ACTN|nr:hypothetical protein [Plantactinospora mayteni]GIH01771.1 hypothetical protein Pma05_83430 [Plantactinospora mayteni]
MTHSKRRVPGADDRSHGRSTDGDNGTADAVMGAPWALGCQRPRRDSTPRIWISTLSDLGQGNYNAFAVALEREGFGSPYENDSYDQLHAQLADLVAQARGTANADFLAHALIAAVRSDLIEHLRNHPDIDAEAGLRELVHNVLSPATPGQPAEEESPRSCGRGPCGGGVGRCPRHPAPHTIIR